MKMLENGCTIGNDNLDENQIKDINRARKYLIEVAERHHVKVYTDIKECIEDICKCYGKK